MSQDKFFRLDGAQRIVIFRALQLGDMLCTVPALRALRQRLPDAQIDYVGLPWGVDFVRRFNAYLDRFIEFPGFPGLPEREVDLAAFPAFIARLQDARYDLAIQMHGSGGFVNSLVMLWGAKHTAGYYLAGEYCPEAEYFYPYPAEGHEIHRHLRLMEFLGAPADDDALEFPSTDADYQELAVIPAAALLSAGNYVCLHPGARYLSRRWLPERFA
jgi:ADP-heptose:LPS heptosyltransferase